MFKRFGCAPACELLLEELVGAEDELKLGGLGRLLKVSRLRRDDEPVADLRRPLQARILIGKLLRHCQLDTGQVSKNYIGLLKSEKNVLVLRKTLQAL